MTIEDQSNVMQNPPDVAVKAMRGMVEAGAEGRRFPRVDEECFVTFRRARGESQEYRTLTKNISLEGACCIRLAQPLPDGERMDLQLLLRGETRPVGLRAEVVWCRTAPSDEGGYDLGLRFLGMTGRERERLRAHIVTRLRHTQE